MKAVLGLLLCASAAATAPTMTTLLSSRDAVADMLDSAKFSTEDKWGVYKNRFSKQYETVDAEDAAFAAFEANNQIILEHNAKDLGFTLGHNEYSDMTWEQFKATYVGGFESNPHLRRAKNVDHSLATREAVADAVDWVTKGAVTKIKNQAQCGSCWAFSTTGSFEGAYQIATGQLVSFSEQELVSCDNAAHGGTDNGCGGGLMDNAFNWIKKNGLCTEDSYPYTSGGGSSGTCATTCTKVATLTGFTDVPSGNEDALKTAVEQQPVSVAIEADKSVFQLYKSGVMSSTSCGKKLDHGVLTVGYGTDSGKDYWKVKNSWGTSWGEEGYIRMERGSDICGIAMQPSYPTGVKKLAPGPSPGPTPPSPGPTPTPPSPGPSPSPSCGVETELECFEKIVPCLTQCESSIGDCIQCLGGAFATCCPCVEKIIPGIPCSGPAPGPSPTPPSPGPTPGPSPSGTAHYEDPKPNGCQSGEEAVRIQGVAGDFCSPQCGSGCPTDVPTGVTATPQCALKTTTGGQYCALICQPGANDGACGKATCKAIQGIGLCTYDD